MSDFQTVISKGYALDQPAVVLGGALLDGEVVPETRVQVALAMLNRHGLVAGATGTGKTKTLQILAGQLADAGTPVFIADVKGDLTGIAVPGDATNDKIIERAESVGWTFTPKAHQVELLSLSGELGAQVRASVHSFGPVLLAKVLDLNTTQTAVLSLVFKFCDDHDLPLLDLQDLRTTLLHLTSDEGKDALKEYGGVSKASVGVILRALVTLEQDGSAGFFGEPSFDVEDLLRQTPDGRGIVSLLELRDVMTKPRLFSTFMLWMLAQLYQQLPEVGDLPQPKLAFFFDEAHLLFDDASDALLEQIELTVRLIRSKGVGVFFVTQSPTDIPSSVLAQLGNRIQHALRAFTPDDADNLRKTARTFPTSEYYEVEKTITSLGIGEALVTVLSPKGIPTPLAATRLVPPDSSMDAVDDATLERLIGAGQLNAKYATAIDRDSAHERITRQIHEARSAQTTTAETAAGAAATQTAVDRATAAQQRAAAKQAEAALKRQATEAARARRAAEKAAAVEARARQRERELIIREASGALRTVFGTFFGRRR